jgi:hypothetical protein
LIAVPLRPGDAPVTTPLKDGEEKTADLTGIKKKLTNPVSENVDIATVLGIRLQLVF